MTSEKHHVDFGATLREARERRGLSLRVIADATSLKTSILLICVTAWILCFLFYLGALFTINKDTVNLRAQMAERAKAM